MTVWFVADRRWDETRVLEEYRDGSVGRIYQYKSLAEQAKYPTEVVWEIKISAKSGEGPK